MTSKFTPTPIMISAAQCLILAMANLQLIEPTVRGYQNDILAKGKWRIRDEFAERLGEDIITDPNQSYLMSDGDFLEYDRLCKLARVAADLKVSMPENCPLLEAQTHLSESENNLIDSLTELTKITSQNILNLGMKKRAEFIDVSLCLLAPFVTNPLSQNAAS